MARSKDITASSYLPKSAKLFPLLYQAISSSGLILMARSKDIIASSYLPKLAREFPL